MENKMNLAEIKEHWENLAQKFAEDLKSTTKTPTIKKLEINALYHVIKSVCNAASNLNVLEVGCGNGHNLLGLSRLLPGFDFTGMDYSPTMIANAQKIIKDEGRGKIRFFVGDVLELKANNALQRGYDIVFTDRCIINLNELSLQLKALGQLSEKVKSGGYLVMIENSTQTYANQNFCRESIGLAGRTPDQYNLFIDESVFLEHARNELRLDLKEINDFGSLHDIILYVLLPKINGGKVDYSHPLMEAVAELSVATSHKFKNAHGSFGQNRLYLFRKP